MNLRPHSLTNLPSRSVLFAFVFALSFDVFAYSIGTGGGTLFANLVELMQSVADFLDGPFILFAAFAILLLILLAWAYAPDNRAVAFLFRAGIALAIAFNLGVIILSLR